MQPFQNGEGRCQHQPAAALGDGTVDDAFHRLHPVGIGGHAAHQAHIVDGAFIGAGRIDEAGGHRFDPGRDGDLFQLLRFNDRHAGAQHLKDGLAQAVAAGVAGGQAKAPAGGQAFEHRRKHAGLLRVVDHMVAFVHDHHAHGAGKLVQLHAVQALHGGDGQLGAAALVCAGDDGNLPLIQPQTQLRPLLGLLRQIQRVGDPERGSAQMSDDRHADLGLSRATGGDQHPLMPLAGESRVHGFLLISPQGEAGSVKGQRLAFEGLVPGGGSGRLFPPDLLCHTPRQGEGVAADLVQHHGLRDVVGGSAQPQGVRVLGVRHGQLPDKLVQQRRRHVLQVQFAVQCVDHGCTTSKTFRMSVGRFSSFTLPRSPLSMRSRM